MNASPECLEKKRGGMSKNGPNQGYPLEVECWRGKEDREKRKKCNRPNFGTENAGEMIERIISKKQQRRRVKG